MSEPQWLDSQIVVNSQGPGDPVILTRPSRPGLDPEYDRMADLLESMGAKNLYRLEPTEDEQ